MTGWAKPVEVMLDELAQEQERGATREQARFGRGLACEILTNCGPGLAAVGRSLIMITICGHGTVSTAVTKADLKSPSDLRVCINMYCRTSRAPAVTAAPLLENHAAWRRLARPPRLLRQRV
jgi:hypothetical protein